MKNAKRRRENTTALEDKLDELLNSEHNIFRFPGGATDNASVGSQRVSGRPIKRLSEAAAEEAAAAARTVPDVKSGGVEPVVPWKRTKSGGLENGRKDDREEQRSTRVADLLTWIDEAKAVGRDTTAFIAELDVLLGGNSYSPTNSSVSTQESLNADDTNHLLLTITAGGNGINLETNGELAKLLDSTDACVLSSDGSFGPGKYPLEHGGCGVAYQLIDKPKGEEQWCGHSWALGLVRSSNDAEMYGTQCALDVANKYLVRKDGKIVKKVVIVQTDSQHVMIHLRNAINMQALKCPIADKIMVQVSELASYEVETRITWVKAHESHLGNNIADPLAAHGKSKSLAGANPGRRYDNPLPPHRLQQIFIITEAWSETHGGQAARRQAEKNRQQIGERARATTPHVAGGGRSPTLVGPQAGPSAVPFSTTTPTSPPPQYSFFGDPNPASCEFDPDLTYLRAAGGSGAFGQDPLRRIPASEYQTGMDAAMAAPDILTSCRHVNASTGYNTPRSLVDYEDSDDENDGYIGNNARPARAPRDAGRDSDYVSLSSQQASRSWSVQPAAIAPRRLP